MDLMTKVIRRLLPPRLFGPTFLSAIDAVSASIETARQFLAQTVDESIPSRATDSLPDWYAQLGLKYDSSLSLETRRAFASQQYTTAGGQSKSAMEESIQAVFPRINLDTPDYPIANRAGVGVAGLMRAMDYPSWYTGAEDGEYPIPYFFVQGAVVTQFGYDRLQGFIERIQPAEMEPVYSVTIDTTTPTARSGRALTGLARSGREE